MRSYLKKTAHISTGFTIHRTATAPHFLSVRQRYSVHSVVSDTPKAVEPSKQEWSKQSQNAVQIEVLPNQEVAKGFEVADSTSVVETALLPWHDDSASPLKGDLIPTEEDESAYRFLHRSPHRHGDLGGYGEDHGFHYPPRVFVDPDAPHIYPYLNKWVMTANVRELRYSHHKPFLHLVDLDKLIRHARLIPAPHKLLNDYIMSRIPITDRNGGILFRYAQTYLKKLGDPYYAKVEEMFERMLATLLPPMDVGVATHEGIIRCCAEVRRWKEGYEWFHARVQREQLQPLRASYYDAVIELCERCGHPDEANQLFRALRDTKRRILRTTLRSMLRLVNDELSTYWNGAEEVFEGSASSRPRARTPLEITNQADTLWGLYDYYHHPRDAVDYELYLNVLAETGRPADALGLVHQWEEKARAPELSRSARPNQPDPANPGDNSVDQGTVATVSMMHGVLYALCRTPGHDRELHSVYLDFLSGVRGYYDDFQTHTYFFFGCAVNGSVLMALNQYRSLCRHRHRAVHNTGDLSAATVMWFIRALNGRMWTFEAPIPIEHWWQQHVRSWVLYHGNEHGSAMVRLCDPERRCAAFVRETLDTGNAALMDALVRYPSSDYLELIITEYLALCARCGAYADAVSTLKLFNQTSGESVNALALTFVVMSLQFLTPGTMSRRTQVQNLLRTVDLFAHYRVRPLALTSLVIHHLLEDIKLAGFATAAEKIERSWVTHTLDTLLPRKQVLRTRVCVQAQQKNQDGQAKMIPLPWWTWTAADVDVDHDAVDPVKSGAETMVPDSELDVAMQEGPNALVTVFDYPSVTLFEPPPPLPPRLFYRNGMTHSFALSREDIALNKLGQCYSTRHGRG